MPHRDVEPSQGYKLALHLLFIDPNMWDAIRIEFVDFMCSNNFDMMLFKTSLKSMPIVGSTFVANQSHTYNHLQ